MLNPCENCGETDDHSCWIDGVVYGPWDDDDDIWAAAYMKRWADSLDDDEADDGGEGLVFVPGVGWRGMGLILEDD